MSSKKSKALRKTGRPAPHSNPEPPPTPSPAAVLRPPDSSPPSAALRALAVAGLLLSGWLLYLRAAGSITHLVGCGAESGCANVLGSRWSQWFTLPVTALSAALYAALLALTFRPRRTASAAIATAIAAAALWFAAVQAFILRQFCPWCIAAHLIGLTAAAIVLLRRPAPAKPGIAIGLTAAAVLIAGQILGPVPDTHFTSEISLPAPNSTAAVPVHQRGNGRMVTFLDNKIYNIASLPHVGDPTASHVLVKYFDYACDACRDLHADLDALLLKHPGKFCILLLPCPINRACNPHVPSHIDDHRHACDLARVSLACWRAEPASFATIHHALFARPGPSFAEALEIIRPLLTTPLDPAAVQDPWIDEILAANADDYRRINVTNSGQLNYLMPKLLVGGTRMLHGVTRSREILFKALEQEFTLENP